ncbi:MAG: cyclophilin-like fold protein [Thermotogota bacterium]|nr:cyclophilin-like fold protein [Thermotogota bacterium]
MKFLLEGIGEAEGELYRMKAPHSVENVWYALPLAGRATIKDDAYAYFLVDIQVKPEHPQKQASAGDIAYWPMSKAICIFWEDAKPYSEINIMGKITSNLDIFSKMNRLTRIVMEKAE